MPDLFYGDAVSIEDMVRIEEKVRKYHLVYFWGHLTEIGQSEPPFDLLGWVSRHTQPITRPIVDKVVAALKEEGITKFGASGYCFGGNFSKNSLEEHQCDNSTYPGRYTFDLAFDNIIKAAVITHPSLIEAPKDLEVSGISESSRYTEKAEISVIITKRKHLCW